MILMCCSVSWSLTHLLQIMKSSMIRAWEALICVLDSYSWDDSKRFYCLFFFSLSLSHFPLSTISVLISKHQSSAIWLSDLKSQSSLQKFDALPFVWLSWHVYTVYIFQNNIIKVVRMCKTSFIVLVCLDHVTGKGKVWLLVCVFAHIH